MCWLLTTVYSRCWVGDVIAGKLTMSSLLWGLRVRLCMVTSFVYRILRVRFWKLPIRMLDTFCREIGIIRLVETVLLHFLLGQRIQLL